MRHHRWILAAALAPMAAGCVSRSAYQELSDNYAAANRRIQELEALAQEAGEDADRYRSETNRLRSDNQRLASNLQQANEEAARTIAQLQAELEDMKNRTPSIPGVEITKEGGSLVFSVAGDVLFDSGKSELKPSARKTLAQVAEQLRGNNYTIEVAGHTDSDPVRVTKDKYKRGNIELGTARALSVWEELKRAGVPEERMLVSSYGEHRPRGSDKARNRRVEIRVRVAEPVAVAN